MRISRPACPLHALLNHHHPAPLLHSLSSHTALNPHLHIAYPPFPSPRPYGRCICLLQTEQGPMSEQSSQQFQRDPRDHPPSPSPQAPPGPRPGLCSTGTLHLARCTRGSSQTPVFIPRVRWAENTGVQARGHWLHNVALSTQPAGAKPLAKK